MNGRGEVERRKQRLGLTPTFTIPGPPCTGMNINVVMKRNIAVLLYYLVRFFTVRRSLPQSNSITPDIGFGVELVKVDALRRIPFQRPLPNSSSLIQQHHNACPRFVHQVQPINQSISLTEENYNKENHTAMGRGMVHPKFWLGGPQCIWPHQ